MKALSIQQPWAWAILHAGKDVENRTWTTPIRGRIAIHAGKKIDREGVEWLRMRGYDVPINLPTGGIVGEVYITGCHSLDWLRDGPAGRVITDRELKVANSQWAFGPICFELANPTSYAELIPMNGRLGFFEVEDPKEATR